MIVKMNGLAGQVRYLEVDASDTVLELKNKIYECELIPPAQQRLVSDGKVLKDDQHTLSQYRIHSNSLIHLITALRGG